MAQRTREAAAECVRQSFDDELLTPAEVAAQLGVTPHTLLRWHNQRVGPARIKVGKQVFYRRQALFAWLQAHETGPVRTRS